MGMDHAIHMWGHTHEMMITRRRVSLKPCSGEEVMNVQYSGEVLFSSETEQKGGEVMQRS